MNEKNEIERHIKSTFESFEVDPPAETWENIQQYMFQPGFSQELREQWDRITHWFRSPVYGYSALVAISILVVVLYVWIGTEGVHHISGHAFAGKENLTAGTAYLLRIHDHSKPFDSVRITHQTSLDLSGKFEFHRVPEGIYIIRINVSPTSPLYQSCRYGYSGSKLCWENAEMLTVNGKQENIAIHLPLQSKPE